MCLALANRMLTNIIQPQLKCVHALGPTLLDLCHNYKKKISRVAHWSQRSIRNMVSRTQWLLLSPAYITFEKLVDMTHNLLLLNTRLSKETRFPILLYTLPFTDLISILQIRKLSLLRKAELSWNHAVLGGKSNLFRIYKNQEFPISIKLNLFLLPWLKLDWKLKIHCLVQFTEAMFQLLGKSSQSTQFSKHKNTKITNQGQIPSSPPHRVLWHLKKQSRPWKKVRLQAKDPWLPLINHPESVI